MFVVREFFRNQCKLVPIQIPANEETILSFIKVTVVYFKRAGHYLTLNGGKEALGHFDFKMACSQLRLLLKRRRGENMLCPIL